MPPLSPIPSNSNNITLHTTRASLPWVGLQKLPHQRISLPRRDAQAAGGGGGAQSIDRAEGDRLFLFWVGGVFGVFLVGKLMCFTFVYILNTCRVH
jgi:hypothetical protein